MHVSSSELLEYTKGVLCTASFQRILLTKSETKKMYKKSESDISVYYTTVENRSRAAQLENDETTKRTNTTATTTTKQQQQHKKLRKRRLQS